MTGRSAGLAKAEVSGSTLLYCKSVGRLSAEQMREYMAQRRARIRAEMIELLGGCCAWCGSTEDLEFDHKDPATKLFAISNGLDKPRAVLLAEVAKCQLLCGPHHREKTLAEGGTVHQGEANGHAKLKEADVLSIFSSSGTSVAALAVQYGVSRTSVRDIRSGRRWSSVTRQVTQVVNGSGL